jgi:hypothetical protein
MRTIEIIPIISTFVLSLAGATASVIGVSIPVDSQDPLCRPSYDNIWTVTVPPFPFNTNGGIGILMNPTWVPIDDNQDFALHQNNDLQPSPLYVAPNVPDPTAAIITYTFDQAEVISGVEIVQHLNGITEVEGFLGDSTNTLISLGSVFGPSGDITNGTPVVPSDGTLQLFNFGNTNVSGTVLRIIIRKTSYPTAFATHRIYPLNASGIPVLLTGINCPADESHGLSLGTNVSATSILATASNFTPHLNTPTFIANSNFQFAVAGVAGSRCIIQTSTNLADWDTLMTNTIPFTFITTKSTADKLRVYRAVYLP